MRFVVINGDEREVIAINSRLVSNVILDISTNVVTVHSNGSPTISFHVTNRPMYEEFIVALEKQQ